MADKKVLGIIPVRLGSTRVPRKMLADICGKPLIYYTYQQAKKAKSLDALVVATATDADEIADTVQTFGAKVIKASREYFSGSDLAAGAVEKFGEFDPDIVVVIWGDEPFMSPEAIDKAVEALKSAPESVVAATVAIPITREESESTNVVNVVFDVNNLALCFSRALIPFPFKNNSNFYKTSGIMAYRRDFISKYVKLPRQPFEIAESVEEMRILENGYKIKVVPGNFESVGVNTSEELELAIVIIKKRLGQFKMIK